MYLFTKYYRTVTDIINLGAQLENLRLEYADLSEHWQKEVKKMEGLKLGKIVEKRTTEYVQKLKEDVSNRAHQVIDSLF